MPKQTLKPKHAPAGYVSIPVKTSKAYRKIRHKRKGTYVQKSKPTFNESHTRTIPRKFLGIPMMGKKQVKVRKSAKYTIDSHYRKGTTVKTSLATRNRKHVRAIPKR